MLPIAAGAYLFIEGAAAFSILTYWLSKPGSKASSSSGIGKSSIVSYLKLEPGKGPFLVSSYELGIGLTNSLYRFWSSAIL